ncbi:MAG: alcohol dehydrogenase catalytic domain-containing protein [Candidatus Latescibacteria bacterium]|nr:alcohol dehydrogenase catalytic domain-containing protein [Candidatus Latescibacterota bacterium]
MQSVRLNGGSAVHIGTAPVPEPQSGQVLVRTVVSALCGSELSTYRGPGSAAGNPGHEAAGVVEKLGPGVTLLQSGQRVGVSAISGCGTCLYCQQGQYTWCAKKAFFGNMHAEYFVAPAIACHALPDDLSWEVGALISGDGFGVPYHTSTKLCDPRIARVAVFGAGPIGQGQVLLQNHLGRQVIAVDLSPRRREYALALGAVLTLDPAQVDPVAAIREFTGGGAEACIEAAGKPATAKQCFQVVRTAGIVVFNGEQPAVELSPSEDFIRRDVWAVGSWYYHFSEFPRMLALYRAGAPVAKLITHHFPLSEAAEAYRAMAAGETGKVLLHYP